MKKPDPEEFTGQAEQKTSENTKIPGYNQIKEAGNKLRHSTYKHLGIEDEEGEVNKRRRNILVAVGASGIGTTVVDASILKELDIKTKKFPYSIEKRQEQIEQEFQEECRLAYGIDNTIVEEHNLADTQELHPHTGQQYLATYNQTQENWTLQGYKDRKHEEPKTVNVNNDEINQLLNNADEEWGEEIIEYCHLD
ncbi:hypothetical protein [Candidatus Nanohalobium constans]|uniref:Uncharacterized protein n=1 Tax=Candidatus Nanohalobium constans TaxID=2565781 RepID=A0A5Q0UEK6_9ARCH|nr:hypothetical protein [Candidatus Nanohalobium constans]QGA79924.1 hypothetical protein LC1Nh_0015 [Candidatus Nanohalobium constans]